MKSLFKNMFTNCSAIFPAKQRVSGLCVFTDVRKCAGKHWGTARAPLRACCQVRTLPQEHTAAARLPSILRHFHYHISGMFDV